MISAPNGVFRIFEMLGSWGTPWGKTATSLFIRMCEIIFFFRLSLVPSKNIENCDLWNILNFQNLEKKFGVSEIPPKWKKLESFWFQNLLEIILMVILSPHTGNLGENWMHSVTYKPKSAKIEIGLNRPPLIFVTWGLTEHWVREVHFGISQAARGLPAKWKSKQNSTSDNPLRGGGTSAFRFSRFLTSK